MIPQTYAQWHDCIVHECKITLTADWIAQRLAILRDRNHYENQKFIRIYGEDHWQRVVGWFEQAAQAAPPAS